MADDRDERWNAVNRRLDDDLDDEAARRVLLAQAGPPVDVEADLRAVHERARRHRGRRMLVPVVVGGAAAAAVAAIVFVRAASEDREIVPAGPGTELPAASTAPELSTPPSSASSVTPTVAPTTPTPASTVPAASGPPPVVPSSGAPASPVSRTETFSCAGGSVTVRWSTGELLLLSVSPAAGWMVDDEAATRDRIDVRFGAARDDNGGGNEGGGGESGSGERRLRLRLRDGRPVLECQD
jgi:hypothetical protein